MKSQIEKYGDKSIRLVFRIAGGKNSVIPKGAIETLTIDIIDGGATFHFIDGKTCRKFALQQQKDGVDSKYIERLQKTACKYPNMNKKEIAQHISERIKLLSVKNV